MFNITFFKAKVELSYFGIIISVGYLKKYNFCYGNIKLCRCIALTDHYVGSGSCHNGCILNVFDQVVHCGPLFPSASSATGSVLDLRIGRKEVGVGFVLVF